MLLIYMLITWPVAVSTAYQYNMYNIDNIRQDGYCLLYYVRDNIVKYYKPYVVAHQIISHCIRPSEENTLMESFNWNNTHDPHFTFAEL
jgi:hypothetical protein